MGFIWSIVLGGLAGWMASKIMKTDAQMGVLANVIVGVVGSMLGFWVAGLLGFAAYGMIARSIVAVAGAALLIAILKGMKVLR
jgi:uncharacterized membrane protein YeaQ/YmgE (transglycosylase-associated protein family)